MKKHEICGRSAWRALPVALLAALSVGAAAQEEAGPAGSGQQASPSIPWDTSCSQVARRNVPDCEMSQVVIVPQSRQVLLRVEVEVPADGSGPRMMLGLPLGLHLPAGLALAIDGQSWQKTVLQTCDGQGCYARIELAAEGLRRLEAGRQLTVVFESVTREQVAVPVELNGFAEAYARIR